MPDELSSVLGKLRDGQSFHYVSGDEYDVDAIRHVMACTSRLPGEFIPGRCR